MSEASHLGRSSSNPKQDSVLWPWTISQSVLSSRWSGLSRNLFLGRLLVQGLRLSGSPGGEGDPSLPSRVCRWEPAEQTGGHEEGQQVVHGNPGGRGVRVPAWSGIEGGFLEGEQRARAEGGWPRGRGTGSHQWLPAQMEPVVGGGLDLPGAESIPGGVSGWEGTVTSLLRGSSGCAWCLGGSGGDALGGARHTGCTGA